jgi:HPt (histidine-containing phosphotransfer) domain-containing protein
MMDKEQSVSATSNGPWAKDVFDLQKALDVVGGDKALFKEIADIFIKGLPEHTANIRKAIAEKNIQEVEQTAHSLKGSIGNFAAATSHEAVYRIERMGKEGTLEGADAALSGLEEELEKLSAALKAALKEM